MKNVKNMIRSLLRWARTIKTGDDTADFPVQQVGYLGKVGDTVMWFPYGMHANIPADELVLMISMQGNPEARVSIPGSPQKRVKPLAASEVVYFHPDTGSKLHFKANGDIEIVSISGSKQTFKVNGDIEIDSQRDANILVAGNAKIDVEGNLDVDAAGTVDIDSVGKTTIAGAGTVKVDGAALVDVVGSEVKCSDGGAVEKLCNEAFLAKFNSHSHPGAGINDTTAIVDTDTTSVLKGE